MSFTPEKFLAVSSYQPPTRLFPDGKVVDLVIAGEPVQVAPARTDTTDSVAFWFPQRRMLVTNFLVIDTIFNIYTLRGGTYRDPQEFLVNDARWVESKNAETLLDIHGTALQGEKNVREAVERSVDSVQLIHDQALRQMASGNGPREAAESVYVPRNLREDREAYGQVESHVRQVYNGNLGWFDGDVYQINPLSGPGRSRTRRAVDGRRRHGPDDGDDGGHRRRPRQLALGAQAHIAAADARPGRCTGADGARDCRPRARAAHGFRERARLLHHRSAADGRQVVDARAAGDARRDPYVPQHPAHRPVGARVAGPEPAVRFGTSSIPARQKASDRRSRSPSKATRKSDRSSCAMACS